MARKRNSRRRVVMRIYTFGVDARARYGETDRTHGSDCLADRTFHELQRAHLGAILAVRMAMAEGSEQDALIGLTRAQELATELACRVAGPSACAVAVDSGDPTKDFIHGGLVSLADQAC